MCMTLLRFHLHNWKTNFFSNNISLIIAAFVTGIVSGCCAWLLKHLIYWISQPITTAVKPDTPNYIFILLPLTGTILAVLYQKYIVGQDIYNGLQRLSNRLSSHNYKYSPGLLLAPIITCSTTIGLGGSAGSEGPIASSGAAIGSNIAQLFRFTPERMRILVACGAGAGIAAIFKAPIGGALFILEIFAISFDAIGFIALFSATTAAALTAFILSGCTPDISFNTASTLHLGDIWITVAAGLFLGLYSTYYAFVMRRIGKLYGYIKNRWIKCICSGISVGILIFLFPSLYGEGYESIERLLADLPQKMTQYSWLSPLFSTYNSSIGTILIFALAILIIKPFATASTINGGGVAGDYTPLLMVGSIAGFLFATAINAFTGFQIPVTDFVFLGMTGVMAGAIKAPLMAMFLTVETICVPSLFLPAATVATVSYLTRLIFSHNSTKTPTRLRDTKNIYK